MFWRQTNQDFNIRLVDVKNEKNIGLLAGVSLPPSARAPRVSVAPKTPFSFRFKRLPRRLQRPVRRLKPLLCQEWCQSLKTKQKMPVGKRDIITLCFFLKKTWIWLSMIRKNPFKSLCFRPCLHGVGDSGLVGRFLLFCVPQSVKTKETNPTRPGLPTPCKQALIVAFANVKMYSN